MHNKRCKEPNPLDANVETRRLAFLESAANKQKTLVLQGLELQTRIDEENVNAQRVETFRLSDLQQRSCSHGSWAAGPAFTRCAICTSCGMISDRRQYRGDSGEEKEKQEVERLKEFFKHEQEKSNSLAVHGTMSRPYQEVDASSESDDDDESDEEGDDSEDYLTLRLSYPRRAIRLSYRNLLRPSKR